MNRLRRTAEGDATWLGSWTGGGYVRSVYAPEPPLCVRSRPWRWSVREPSLCAKRGAVFISIDPAFAGASVSAALGFMIWIERLRRDPLIRVHPVHLRLCYPCLSVLHLPSGASPRLRGGRLCAQWFTGVSSAIWFSLAISASRSALLRAVLGARTGFGCDHVSATVEKAKHPACEKFSIPLRARSCAIFGRCVRTEFRHDSCNTAPR